MHTFVILAYKESEYLEECILSVLSQNIRSKVLISTSTYNDHIKNLSDKYKIQLVVNPHRNKISDDWNDALKLAETPLVTLAHQDDIYEKTYTKNILKYFENYPDSLIYFTNYNEFIEKKENIKTFNINVFIKRFLLFSFLFKKSISSAKIKKLSLIFGNPISCPTVTYNILKLNNFRFSDKYQVNLDWDAWLRLSELKGGFTYISEILLYHRLHKHTETNNSIYSGQRRKEDKQIIHGVLPKYLAFFYGKIYSLSEVNNKFDS